uniref:Pre-rRNA-processing protein RIX1 N-terminal domain-containing protein n=1 Tax=Plectus sambesii TaxID=2011161 RepID=A0A914V357_9BILA
MEALRELHAVMAAADSQDFVDKCEDWFDALSLHVGWRAESSTERDLAWLLLTDLVRESAVFPNLSRTLGSGKLQKRIVDALKQPMTAELLIFLNALVRFYPGSCGSNQADLTALALSALEHSDIVVRTSGADFLTLACRLGPAGEKGTLHTRAWTELTEKLLNTLKLHIAGSFDRELVVAQDLTPASYLKLRPLDSFAFDAVTQRVETLFMGLERSLEAGVELQLAPRFPMTSFMEVLQSALVKDVTDCPPEFLPRLHRAGLAALKFVSQAVGLHLAPFCRRLYQLLLDELLWAQQSAHHDLQEDACSALTNLIDQFGISTGAHLSFDRLWKAIGENIVGTGEKRSATQLMRASANAGQMSGNKKRKRKHGETSGHASDLFVGRRPQWRGKRSVLVASCSLLSSVLRMVGSFVKSEILTECQRSISALALSIAAARRRNELHDGTDVQVGVLSVLRQLLQIGHASVAAPAQIATTVFALCAQQVETRVRIEAQLGMAVCRTLSRPLMPSLESAVVSAAPKSAAATVEDDVEEPIILN